MQDIEIKGGEIQELGFVLIKYDIAFLHEQITLREEFIKENPKTAKSKRYKKENKSIDALRDKVITKVAGQAKLAASRINDASGKFGDPDFIDLQYKKKQKKLFGLSDDENNDGVNKDIADFFNKV